jgi:RIP metalloprotease RseP
VTATTERIEHGGPVPPAAPETTTEGGGALPAVLLLGGLVLVGLLFGPEMVIVVLGFVALIFFHELGHYVAARRSGMKVTEFFLGFGPHIWSFQRGETRYGVKAIPAGAYVKIIGMSNLDEADPADEARTYRRQSYPKRLVTVLAGPATNIFLAFVLLVLLLVTVGMPDREAWTIEEVSAQSGAEAAGLQPGDRVLAFDGTPVATFEDLFERVGESGGTEVELLVDRRGEELSLVAPIGERLTPEGAAAFTLLGEGTIMGGDRILALDGVPTTYRDLYAAVATGEERTLTVDDGAAIGDVQVRIGELVPPEDATIGFLGVRPDTPLETVSLLSAPGEAVRTTGTMLKEGVLALGRFFTPGTLGDFIGGAADTEDDVTAVAQRPVADPDDENRILSIVGALNLGSELAEEGWAGLLYFFVTVNVFVALVNLIPLLPFDGGHAVVATYERLRGRQYRVDIRKLMPVTYAVVSLFIFLAVIALFRDVMDPVQL